MAKRGRKTSGDLGAVESIPTRPEPPRHLNKEQAAVWRRVTKGLPTEWFGEHTLDHLESYCTHIARFKEISAYIDGRVHEMEPAEYCRLAKQAEGESRAAMSAATKMRMTQQSTYDREKKKDPGVKKTPWQNLNN